MEQDELIKTVLSAQTGNAEAHGNCMRLFGIWFTVSPCGKQKALH